MSRLDQGDRWTRTGMYCQAQCHGVGRGHLAYYQALERAGLLRFVKSSADLDETIAAWQNPDPTTPFGLILAMESADPILGPDQVPEWHELGLRLVSISHYGTSTYSHGTGTEGGLLPPAKPLPRRAPSGRHHHRLDPLDRPSPLGAFGSVRWPGLRFTPQLPRPHPRPAPAHRRNDPLHRRARWGHRHGFRRLDARPRLAAQSPRL